MTQRTYPYRVVVTERGVSLSNETSIGLQAALESRFTGPKRA